MAAAWVGRLPHLCGDQELPFRRGPCPCPHVPLTRQVPHLVPRLEGARKDSSRERLEGEVEAAPFPALGTYRLLMNC